MQNLFCPRFKTGLPSIDRSASQFWFAFLEKQKTLKPFGFSVLVRLKGLEPLTYWFVASHSIQLSYSRIPRFGHRPQQQLSHNNTSVFKMQVFFQNFLNFFILLFQA